MPTITTKDGVEIYYKDWGSGQPIVFSHGWPLSADDWDKQMLFFMRGSPVAHDRRGHGRSTQVGDGHDMDHYADDFEAVVDHLELQDTIHVGHSTGGGEVVRYLGRRGERGGQGGDHQRSATTDGENGANQRAFPRRCSTTCRNNSRRTGRSFTASCPRDRLRLQPAGRKASEAVIANWWRLGMMGGAKAHYDGIVAFSQTDFTEDLKKISIPVLVMHSEDDQIVPYVASGPKSAELLANGTLKTYTDFPHGMPTTHADVINADLLEFLQS